MKKSAKQRVNFYLDMDLVRRLKITAKKDRRSMTSYLNSILDKHLPDEDNTVSSFGKETKNTQL